MVTHPYRSTHPYTISGRKLLQIDESMVDVVMFVAGGGGSPEKAPKKAQPYSAGDSSPVHVLGPTFLFVRTIMKVDRATHLIGDEASRKGFCFPPVPILETTIEL
jgi:hypothetical protein